MDINDYMERQIALLERIAEGVEAIVQEGIFVSNASDAESAIPVTVIALPQGSEVRAIGSIVHATSPAPDAQAESAKPARAKGSTKQAANHDRDDAKQEAEAPATGKPPTADDLRAALMALGQVQGSAAAIALLGEHGSTSVSGLDPERYAAVIAAAEAAVREAGK